jgi:YD repeat-containing protein
MKTKISTRTSHRHFSRTAAQVGAILWLAFPSFAPATSLQLNFTVPSSFNESNRQAVLEWNAEPARIYLVQSTDDLSPGTTWKTEESVMATAVGPLRWMAPEAIRDRKYYRLILPRPEVFSVEPAFVNSDDPAALFYLIGQCFPTNGSVVINGLNFTPTLVDSNGGWLAISLNGLPPGTPILGNILVLDNASNIVTTLPLQNPVLYGTELTAEQLQGPPDEPPASPTTHIVEQIGYAVEKVERPKSAARGHVTVLKAADNADDGDSAPAFLSKKGYDYYQAQSQINHASRHQNPYFQGNNTEGAMPLSKKGYEYYQAQSALRFEVQEGKKGLNAVNVKLAYRSGEILSEETDLAIPGRGLDFAWTRTYRSRTETTTAQGAGWDFSYNVSAIPQPDGTVVLRPGNGHADTFYSNGTNGWTRDEYFLHLRDVDQDGAPDEVVFPDGGKWTLHPPGTSFTGKLAEIVDRNNNTIRCEYDTDTGRLLRVVDTLDRTNTVAYTSKGLIESVTDFSGRMMRYEYDSGADLIACISPAVIGTPHGNDFPGGKTNRYTYSSGNLDQRLNHNLVAITDPKGQVCLEVTYQATNDPASLDFDTVSSVLRGVDKKDIRRGMVIARPSNSFATVQTIVNDYVGNVTEYLFDSRQRCVSVREFTGRANPALPTTVTENRPTDKLRAEDPDYFETRWEWNADSLCTLEIRPDGGSTEISHQRAQDHNSSRSNKTASRAHDGDVRVVRERASSPVDMDGDGTPDTTELAWYFEYDPRFGSPANMRSRLNELESRLQVIGLLGRAIGGNGGINEMLPDTTLHLARTATDSDKFAQVRGFKVDIDGFVVSTTDPRGNSATCDYDAQGNARRITFKAKEGATLARTLDFVHNAHGQVTAITNAADANGDRRVNTFTYYTSGPQESMVEVMMAIGLSGGLSLTTAFEYDDRGNVTRVVDPRGNDRLFTYNALDQCVTRQTQQASFGERVKTVFHYDANDNVVRCDVENRDETGALVAANPHWTTLFEHDAFDRRTGIVQEISEDGGLPGSYATNRLVYDGNDNLTEARSPLAVSGTEPDNTVAFEYDERGLLFREITAPGSGHSPTNEYGYSLNGMRTRINELEAKLSKLGLLAYDGFNRPISYTDPMSNVVSYVYDRNGNVTRTRYFGETNDVPGNAANRLLAETRYTYDSLDRCVQQVDSFFDIFTELTISDGQATTTFSYAPNGAFTSVTDDNGHTTRYAYDGLGRLAAVTDPKTNVVQFAYDACDNLTNVISTALSDVNQALQQFSTVHTYDALNRCTSSTDNVGNTNRYAYDSRGNVVSHLDPRENESLAVFDGLGRCVATTNYVGKERGLTINTSHVEYDTNSRRTAATDSNGNTTTYTYDSLDRCIAVTEADGTSCSLVWSPRSNLLWQQDANGTVITNVYDLLDRCVSRVITPGPTVASTTTFETFAYDGLSRCIAASNDVSLATFAYDSLGHLVRTTQDGLSTSATYDAVGNCLALTYPGGRGVAYTHDALDQVSSLSSSSGGLPPVVLSSFAYDGPGRLGRITRANNVNSRYQWNGLVSPPNTAGDYGWLEVSGVNHQVEAGTVVDRRVFSYDRNQNKLTRTQTVPFFPGGPTTTNVFAYDALDRLTDFARLSGAAGDYAKIHSLDGNGNRLITSSNGLAFPYVMDNTFPDPADFQMNQYTLTPFVVAPEQYDANGNLIGRTTASAQFQYVYDYADRLVAVNDLFTGLSVPVTSFNYDALGRRLSKTIYPSGLPPVTTQFAYAGPDDDCGGSIIEERVNGTLRRSYAFPHVFDQKGRVMFTDAGETYFFHTDELGNTLALTDASGAVVERCDYDDYGAPIFLSTDGLPTGEVESGVGNPFLFHGMTWDSETGLYYWKEFSPAEEQLKNNPRHRTAYLDPKTGRATRGKVIDVRDNGMGFAANNPWSGGAPIAIQKGTVKFFNETKGFGFVTGGGSKAQDHNSSRSNKSGISDSDGRVVRKMIPITVPDITGAQRGGSGSRSQDHNSSRSNKSGLAGGGGGGGSGGDLLKQLLYTAKTGKTGQASGK